jgi:hypothetical protein
MPVEILMAIKAEASEYLGCSLEELERWIEPDRVLPWNDGDPARRGRRLWSGPTLDAAKPHIGQWRERDGLAAEIRGRNFAEAQAA